MLCRILGNITADFAGPAVTRPLWFVSVDINPLDTGS